MHATDAHGGIVMQKRPRYYIVEASALPEVFLKVAQTKHLLETGAARTVNDAARITGISRSAFYKYRDAIFPFQDLMAVLESSRISGKDPGFGVRLNPLTCCKTLG